MGGERGVGYLPLLTPTLPLECHVQIQKTKIRNPVITLRIKLSSGSSLYIRFQNFINRHITGS